jgi:Mlc titration factor MtfA (ptsG expression regulator)
MFDWWRRLSRAEALAQPFPAEYRSLIERRVPLAKHLSEAELGKLEALVRIMMSEKTFQGAGGLELSEEMCLVIAARACLLVLHRVELDEPLYPTLDSIIVYPSTYRAPHREQHGYVVVEGEQRRLGESWSHGAVVLSWDAVLAGGNDLHDGHDVVLHEFAHQLDAAGGDMDGTPELDSWARYAVWAKIAGNAYKALYDAVVERRPTTIDPYGATNAPEFFAVVVEQFFETPGALASHHPALYAELVAFFRIDPAQRLSESAG